MNIALIGFGKMGKAIEQVIEHEGTHHIVARFTSSTPINIPALKQADVAIEFTTPNIAIDNIKLCMQSGVPCVCGSTGWLDKLDTVRQMVESYHGALVYGSNFSIGVNLFFELNNKLAQLMHHYPQYHARIEETHHIYKKDAPSGTAITLAEGLIRSNENYTQWALGNTHEKGILPVIAYREADVPGTHIVTYSNAIDTISISHLAHSREGFASGAVAAAGWIYGKKGVFAFKEVLGL